MEAGPDEGKGFEAPAGFRQAVAAAVRPGSVVVVTPQSLKAGSPGQELTVIEDDPNAQ